MNIKHLLLHAVVCAMLIIVPASADAKLYDATFLNTSEIPTTLTRGSTVIPIHVKNAGTLTWDPNDTHPVRVGIWLENPSTGLVVGTTNARAYLPSVVLPGGQASMNFTVPSYWPAGNYNLRMDMVQEWQTWFSDQGCTPLTIAVTVSGIASGSYYQTITDSAIADLNSHFWVGSYTNGHIYDPLALVRNPGDYLWENATFLFVLENMYEATGNTQYQQQVQAHWNYVKSKWGSALPTCGFASPVTPSPCQDDSAWSLMMFLKVYNATNDPYALQCAQGLATAAYNRWYDTAGTGGMWYSDYWNDPSNDAHYQLKSLYQSAIAMGFFRLWELAGNQTYKTYADNCYNWIQNTLRRSDNLYWNSIYHNGLPSGGMYAIHEAGSVTYLGGNMMMAVLNARYYRLTGNDTYRQNALNIVAAIRTYITDPNGALIDDMDLWSSGSFATEYALEVLTLPGISSQDVANFQKTAVSIYKFDRTSDGYYGGCWGGPIGNADGTGTPTPWTQAGNYNPNQIMTSANAVGIMAAAACYPFNTAPQYGEMFLKTYNVPTSLVPGQTVMPIHVVNTGSLAWNPNDASHPVRVGIWLEDIATGSRISGIDSRAYLASTVPAGGEAIINFVVPANWPKGTYDLKMDMVQEWKTWFSSQGCLSVSMVVTVGAENLLWNGDFESWTSNKPSSWRWFAVNGAVGYVTQTSAPGTYSSGRDGMLLAWDNNAGDSALDMWLNKTPATSQHIYRLLFDAKHNTGEFALRSDIYALQDEAVTRDNLQSWGGLLTSSFQTFGEELLLAPNENNLCVRFDVANGGGGASTYIDNARLEDVTYGNRLFNGDFENSSSQLLQWRFFTAGGSASASISPDAQSSSNAALLSVTSIRGATDIGLDTWDNRICVIPGEPLQVAFHAKKVSGISNVGLTCQVIEFNSAGTPFLAHDYFVTPITSTYSTFAQTFTLDPATAYASVGFRITDSAKRLQTGSFLIDNVSLGAPVAVAGVSINDAKKQPYGAMVSVNGAIVSRVLDPNTLYIETDNRTSGIRVQKPSHGVSTDSVRVNVTGLTYTNSMGEYYIDATSVQPAGSGSVKALGLTNKSLPGGVGLDNTGLLVRTWGKVVEIDPAATPVWLTIDDDSSNPVKCLVSSGVVINPSWTYVAVTGIASRVKNDSALNPILYVSKQSDITPQ